MFLEFKVVCWTQNRPCYNETVLHPFASVKLRIKTDGKQFATVEGEGQAEDLPTEDTQNSEQDITNVEAEQDEFSQVRENKTVVKRFRRTSWLR